MKYLKKYAGFFLTALLILTVSAAACEGGDCLYHWEVDCIGEESAEAEVVLMETDLYGAEDVLIKGMREMQESISIWEYQIALDDFLPLVEHINSTNPDLFMMLGCSFAYSGNTVTTVYPKYTMTSEEYLAAKAVYEDSIAAIVEQVNPRWSELEQVLFVHDYLASHFQYDLSYSVYDAYRFFESGIGVCEAYAKTFIAVAQELGIEVSYVKSMSLNHVWNLVKIGGEWYHLDVTHDDPITDRLGYARHTYFLQSDAKAIMQRKEALGASDLTMDWNYGNGEACTDTTYDSYFWRDAISPFLNVGGMWYAVTEEGLKNWDGASNGFGEMVDVFQSPSSGLGF